MNAAVGCDHFLLEWAEQSRKFYATFLKDYDPEKAQRELAAAAEAQPPSELAKNLRLEHS